MKPTIYDVAKEAGVTASTVSRVINGNSRISTPTIEKVQTAIQKLGYKARVRQCCTTSECAQKMVAILTMDFLALQFGITIDEIQRGLEKLGYSCIVCTIGEDPKKLADCVSFLDKIRIFSIVCIGAVFAPSLEETKVIDKYPHIPFILCNYYYPADNAYSILLDEYTAAQMAVDYLWKCGHKEILFVKDNDGLSEKKIHQGFIDGMKKYGLSASKDLFIQASRSLKGGWEAAEKIISSGIKFTAVICNDDSPAVGLMQCLQKFGYAIPKDVAVIGFNNSIIGQCCTPALTAVNKKIDVIGSFVVNDINLYASGQEAPHQITIVPELVIKEST